MRASSSCDLQNRNLKILNDTTNLSSVMRIKNTLLFAFSFLLLSCQSTKKLPVLPEHSLSVGTQKVSFAALKSKIQEVPVAYNDTYGNGKEMVIGFPLTEVLKNFLGENWKEVEALHFSALDGYKTIVPMHRILKYQPILAYRYFDATRAFVVDKKTKKPQSVELGPYYLVWNNIQHPELSKLGNKDWPYQVSRIDSVKHASQFVFSPATTPLKKRED